MRYLLVGVMMLVLWGPSARAEEQRRGLVTSAECPYTCKDAGIPAAECRERQIGDRCEVEDLRQAPGHRTLYQVKRPAGRPTAHSAGRSNHSAGRSGGNNSSSEASSTPPLPASGQRGLVTSSSCPFDCRMAGVPSGYCRAWRDGDRCNVEDLRQPPGHRTLMR